MQRTQIYFPKDLYQDLKIGARAMNISLSEYIRRILKEKLYANPMKEKTPKKKKASLMTIAENAVNLGSPDLARNFSKYFEKSLR